MNECLEWVNDCINDEKIGEGEKLNFVAFQKALNSPEIVENHGGRYLLIRNGVVYRDTFESPQDAICDEFGDDCILYRIPNVDDFDTASIFYSGTTESNGNESFKEFLVPVTITINNPPAGCVSTEYSGNFMVDTGATYTSCPCYVELSKTTVKGPCPNDGGKCLVEYKWDMLAFWGRLRLASIKQGVKVRTTFLKNW